MEINNQKETLNKTFTPITLMGVKIKGNFPKTTTTLEDMDMSNIPDNNEKTDGHES